MPKVKLLVPVTYCGSIVDAGEEIELSERSANSLVADKLAEVIADQDPATLDENDETGGGSISANPGDENAPTGEINGQEENADEEALAKIKKALDDGFNKEPLAEKAKEIGVEFPYDAKKAEIIDAIITAGKAEVILQA